MIGAATLKKKGSKPSDPDVFWVKFKEPLQHLGVRDALQGETLQQGQGGASGLDALEGQGDEEMLDGQGGVAESNRNPDLMNWILKSSAMCVLSVTTTSSTLKDLGSCEEEVYSPGL